jgi:hypothetical protein
MEREREMRFCDIDREESEILRNAVKNTSKRITELG